MTNYSNFEFMPIDKNKFPAVELGYQVMKVGGLAPHIFNYLNEILVNLFINKRIKFLDIVKLNEVNMDKFFGKNFHRWNKNQYPFFNFTFKIIIRT